MQIPLNDKYTLVSDQLNVYIVEEGEYKREPTGGRKRRDETVERVFCGYHGNLQNCLLSFVKHSINNSQAETFNQLFSDIEKIESYIKEFCKSIDSELIKQRKREK